MTLNWFELLAEVNGMNIEYHKVKPNLRYIGLNEKSEPIFEFSKSTNGISPLPQDTYVRFILDPLIRLGAFREKMRGFNRKSLTFWYKKSYWNNFVNSFNYLNYSPKKKKKTYILATSNGRAIGLMTNYKQVTHQELLQTIKDAGLAAYTDGWFTNHQMTLRIRLNTTTQGFSYLKIVNGFTGQVSLNYLFGIQVGFCDKTYQFSEPLKFSRKRHLSKVGELLSVIDSAVETVRDIKIIDSLTKMRYQTAFDIMFLNQETKRQEVLVKSVQTRNSESPFINAMEMISFLGSYRCIRGYANSIDKLVEPIIQLALLD